MIRINLLPSYKKKRARRIAPSPLPAGDFSLGTWGAIYGGAIAVWLVVLGVIGLYGVLSYVVAQRTREIGVRMALGARAPKVFALVLKEGVGFVLVGMVLGLGVALAATRLLSSILFNVRATDPLTFVVVSALLLLAAFVACLLPTRRATNVDPLVALRTD